MSGKTLLWDFDGTLATRPRRWGGAMIEALDRHVPDHGFVPADLRPHLRTGFPWHEPERPHPELDDPAAWWERLENVMRRAYEALGLGTSVSPTLARTARSRYVDPESFELYDDALPALNALRTAGWRHVVLSNHVPELESIVRGVGLHDLFDHVITSARIGFDKPHPEAYAIARRLAGDPEQIWMIGDNPVADVHGAEAVGIPAILVRSPRTDVARRADDLHGAQRFLQ